MKNKSKFFKNFKLYIAYFLSFFLINIELSLAANVNSVSQSTGMNFGSFAASNSSTSGGTISTSGATTGSVKSFGGYNIGNFAVVARRSGGSNNRLTFNVIIPSTTTISTSGGSMTLYLSLDPNSLVNIKQFNLPNNISGNQTYMVPVYGGLVVSGTQTPGNYAGSFTFKACRCNNSGCQTNC